MALIIQLTPGSLRILNVSGRGPDELVAELTPGDLAELADAIHAGQRWTVAEGKPRNIGKAAYGSHTTFEEAMEAKDDTKEDEDVEILRGRIEMCEDLLQEIGDLAHEKSAGPAVHDGYWEIRQLAYFGDRHPTKLADLPLADPTSPICDYCCMLSATCSEEIGGLVKYACDSCCTHNPKHGDHCTPLKPTPTPPPASVRTGDPRAVRERWRALRAAEGARMERALFGDLSEDATEPEAAPAPASEPPPLPAGYSEVPGHPWLMREDGGTAIVRIYSFDAYRDIDVPIGDIRDDILAIDYPQPALDDLRRYIAEQLGIESRHCPGERD